MINVSQIICNKHVSAKYSSIAANLYEGFHSKRLQWWHIGQIPNQIPTGTWRTGNYLEFSYRIIEKLVNFFTFDFIFPLQMQIERQQFEATINKLNEYFAEAEKGSCSTYWWAFDLEWTKYSRMFCFLLLIHELWFDFQWRMLGMYNSLFSLLVHGNTLRKSKYRYSMRFFLSIVTNYSIHEISVLLFAVHSKGIQVYWSTEWTNLQSKRFTNNRSNVSWITSNRNINTRSSWKNLTATFAFNRRIFYVNFLNQSRQKKEKYCLIPL